MARQTVRRAGERRPAPAGTARRLAGRARATMGARYRSHRHEPARRGPLAPHALGALDGAAFALARDELAPTCPLRPPVARRRTA
jgi:hypothetical protein